MANAYEISFHSLTGSAWDAISVKALQRAARTSKWLALEQPDQQDMFSGTWAMLTNLPKIARTIKNTNTQMFVIDEITVHDGGQEMGIQEDWPRAIGMATLQGYGVSRTPAPLQEYVGTNSTRLSYWLEGSSEDIPHRHHNSLRKLLDHHGGFEPVWMTAAPENNGKIDALRYFGFTAIDLDGTAAGFSETVPQQIWVNKA